ncbi:hypothetical protein DQP57_00230 [Mycobacterium colombiense]|uniref:Uncharacterized protein n=1 Tax=Mycobacterium colombiense TaxID=339268 RepID=A0A329MBP8_9MYCO|nr:hypothetical protein DQP57_00230 [Mycobacterium colombiense]
MDHKEIAEALLGASDVWAHGGIAPDGRPQAWPSALTHAILALCDRLDALPAVIALTDAEECEEGPEDR